MRRIKGDKEKKKSMKIDEHWKEFIFVGIILILLISTLVFYSLSNELSVEEIEKEYNITCVKQQTTCCSCEMGGEEECMTEQEAAETQARLERECKKDIVCIALYACEDFECKCINGTCQKVVSKE